MMMQREDDFDIGSMVVTAVAGRFAPIFMRGAPRWYALRVGPQREDQVETWLEARGVYAFHPVIRQVSRVRGVARPYFRRYLPGLVFARFKGEAVTHNVLACSWISGAICRADGTWGVLEPTGLAGLHEMRKRHVNADADAKIKSAAKLRCGSRAMFQSGVFAGVECEIIELQVDGGFSVSLQIFGTDRIITAARDEIAPL